VCILGGVALGCGSGSDEDGENLPPVWHDAPTALTVGQGQRVVVPLVVSDPEGETVVASLSVPPTTLQSSIEGEQLVLHAGYGPPGADSLEVTLSDESGASRAVSIGITVAALAWQPTLGWVTEGPEAREHGSMVVDPEARAAYLFGGSGYSPYLEGLADGWRFDLDAGTWSALVPQGSVPAPGGSRRVAVVAESKQAYLHGGYADGGQPNLGDLYRLDYGTGELVFSEITQVGAPSARALHAFVYDPVIGRFFMFGGTGSGISDETWVMELDGDTALWTRLELAVRPTPRYGFFYGFDVQAGRLLVFSGAQGYNPINPAGDTWALDVRSDPPAWILLADGASGPSGRRNGCMIFDAGGSRLWVFGGTADAMTTESGLFAFDARPGEGAWIQLELEGEPALRSSGFGVYDPVLDRTYFGFGNTTAATYRDFTALGY